MVAGGLGILVVAAIALSGGESASMVATQFMSGLAVGDLETVLRTSTISDMDAETQRKVWKDSLERGRYYRFRWKYTAESPQSADATSILLAVERNVAMSSYDENFQIPCRKIDGKWKVDVRSLSRQLYPFLPR